MRTLRTRAWPSGIVSQLLLLSWLVMPREPVAPQGAMTFAGRPEFWMSSAQACPERLLVRENGRRLPNALC